MTQITHLNEPCKEEDHCDEEEVSPPGWEAIQHLVHDEDPALQGGTLVHCEDAHSW